MNKISLVTLLLALTYLPNAFAQNVGINASDPEQPLEVGGVIFTNQGGLMFPDSSLQTTAAGYLEQPNPDIDPRTIAYMTYANSSSSPTNRGPIDDLFLGEDRLENAFPIYSFDVENGFDGITIDQGGINTGGGKVIPSGATFTRDADFFSHQFLEVLLNQDRIFVTFYFLENPDNPRVYRKVDYYASQITNKGTKVMHQEKGLYTHKETLTVFSSCFEETHYIYSDGPGRNSTNVRWNFASNNGDPCTE